MRFAAYPKYKTSGVEWLGDVPEHWEALPLKRRHRVVNGGTPSSSEDSYWDGEINWITPEDLGRNESKRIGNSRRTLSVEGLSNCGAQIVPRDSIVISTRAPIGHVAVTERESCTNQGCRTLVSADRRVSADYVYYSLSASRPVLQAAGKGTTFMELSAGLLGSHAVPFPPFTEQRAIADFLDRETAKIDALVAKKRLLIERLKEKRTALISRTVTRGLPPDAARAAGLDPHPKLKPSGIDWLGDVPEHWQISRIKHLAKIESGHTPSRSVDEYWIDCTIPWVSLNDSGYLRTHEYITDTVYQINELGLANSSARMLPAGAVVFSRDATVGLCAITTRPMAVSQHFVAYLCGPRLLPEYLLLSLDVMGQHLVSLSLGATISTIGMDDVRSLSCAVPPFAEQEAIVEYLSRAKAQIDGMLAKVETAIQRLQEYRTALITAAVTGKIDVRALSGADAAGTMTA